MRAEDPPTNGKPGGDEGPGPAARAFGEQVRSVQRGRGLTVRAFAEQLGISHGFLCDVQAGKAKPSPALVARIDELGELHGALVRAYPGLLAEHETRKRARAARRRELLGKAKVPASARSNRSPESSGKAAIPLKPRYSGETTALQPQATAREDDANRREAIKTLGALVAAGATRARSFLRYVESPNVGPRRSTSTTRRRYGYPRRPRPSRSLDSCRLRTSSSRKWQRY
jgi:transcriptional regulator with XRE-family HTH domain